MRNGILTAAALGLLQVSHAKSAHIAHEHRHHARDGGVATSVDTVTNVGAVYVDSDGNPVSTSLVSQATAAPQAPVQAAADSASAPVASVPAAPAEAKNVATDAAPAASSNANAASSSSASTATSDTSSTNAGGNNLGINYSPYHADGTCKTASQVAADLAPLASYATIRSYGTDCNQVPNILAAAKTNKQKVMLGIFDIGSAQSEAQTLINGVNSAGGWATVNTVSVGNEAVNSGTSTAAQVVAAVQQVRSMLRSAGFTGDVVTVDTFNALIANPALCQNSDHAAANAHAFFDSDNAASDAGTWAKTTAQQVMSACGGKKTVITESGWPSAGQANGKAVPSVANQKAAVASLQSAFSSGGLFLFEAYNSQWKQAGAFGVEQSFGILGNSN